MFHDTVIWIVYNESSPDQNSLSQMQLIVKQFCKRINISYQMKLTGNGKQSRSNPRHVFKSIGHIILFTEFLTLDIH